MGPNVALKQPGPRERLAADGANAGQRVRADVHFEGAQAGVLLVAVLAGKAALSLQVAVQLLVPGQPSHCVVGLVAVGTLEATWRGGGLLSPQQSVWSLVPICAEYWGPPCGQNQQWGQVEVVQAVFERYAGSPASARVHQADFQGVWLRGPPSFWEGQGDAGDARGVVPGLGRVTMHGRGHPVWEEEGQHQPPTGRTGAIDF